jgi:hypothetical protein
VDSRQDRRWCCRTTHYGSEGGAARLRRAGLPIFTDGRNAAIAEAMRDRPSATRSTARRDPPDLGSTRHPAIRPPPWSQRLPSLKVTEPPIDVLQHPTDARLHVPALRLRLRPELVVAPLATHRDLLPRPRSYRPPRRFARVVSDHTMTQPPPVESLLMPGRCPSDAGILRRSREPVALVTSGFRSSSSSTQMRAAAAAGRPQGQVARDVPVAVVVDYIDAHRDRGH